MEVNLSKNYGKKLFAHKNDKTFFLFLGLALWFAIPILGIFPLLFFVHLNQKRNSKLNLIINLLVALTITTFVSSLDVISDLAVYTDNYEKLGKYSPFEISGGRGVEFVMWVLSYPVYLVSNGSRYAFVFSCSLLFNLLTFLVITKGFSPKNHGLLALFIASSPNFLGYQGFLVRQYLATVIFLVAVVNIERKPLMWGIYLISLCTHVGNLLYLPVLVLYDKTKLRKSNIVKILLVASGFAVTFSTSLVYDLASLIKRFLPSQYGSIILAKTFRYSREQAESTDLGIAFIEHFIVFAILIILVNTKSFKTSQEKLLYFLYPIFLFIMFMGRNIDLFSNRFAFILFPFAGLFYYFLIENDWMIFKREILTVLLIGKIIYFCYFLNTIDRGDIAFNYMNNQAFTSNIFDYIEVVNHGFTEDIKIKDLPPNRYVD